MLGITVIQPQHMSELLGTTAHIGGMWHAHSYDPALPRADLLVKSLGLEMQNCSMFDCYDHNYFATDFLALFQNFW